MITDSCDLIREFRLRRWARENYVPAQDRKPTWDATVLDEMACRDAEMETISIDRGTEQRLPLSRAA